eukprot:m51a1_g4724 hypothetical protein (231) ;mRNA; f:329444-330391
MPGAAFYPHGIEDPVFQIEISGVQQVAAAYRAVLGHTGADCVVLVDGGTDSLMRGDESGLGTPNEDATSIAAVHSLGLAPNRAFLLCTAMGVDCYHGVCHSHFLENSAALDRQGHFLGSFSLTRGMPEAALLEQAFAASDPENSIVASQLLAAVRGEFGDYHSNPRTRGSELYVSPLMAQYWAYRLCGVAQNLLYLGDIAGTKSHYEVAKAINSFRRSLKSTRAPRPIPY